MLFVPDRDWSVQGDPKVPPLLPLYEVCSQPWDKEEARKRLQLQVNSSEVCEKISCKIYDDDKTWLIEAEWRIYTSVQHTSIGSDNGLSPVRRQAIFWINAAILSIKS